MLFGACAWVCFVLQQFLVPLHLTLNDHVSSSVSSTGPGEHVRSHAGDPHGSDGHRHEHEPARLDDANEDHEPHPVEDHLEQLAVPVVLPALVHTAIGPAPAAFGILAFERPSRKHSQIEERGPRPPPPRRAAAPRAPPIVV